MTTHCDLDLGGSGCLRTWVPTNLSYCRSDIEETCIAAAATLYSNTTSSVEDGGGFAYGAIVSIICDIAIAAGLGLQKTGHNRLLAMPESERDSVFYQPVWVLGLILMISGEVGNLVAYGDRNTPTAVITAVGCIGVVANLVIATVFLKEPFRVRDVMGGVMVVCGVVLVTAYCPTNPVPLNGDRLNQYLVDPGAIVIYCVFAVLIVTLFFAVKKVGETSVFWYLMLSSAIGAFTVMSSKPVSTFATMSIQGLANACPHGGGTDRSCFFDEWDSTIFTEEECALSDGFGDGTVWRIADDDDLSKLILLNISSTVACYKRGFGQLHQPAFWVFIVILIVTAVAQVKYLNDALSRFSNSEVIPVHYVLFTLLSVTASTIVYQEYSIPEGDDGCPQYYKLHLFLDGVFGTFAGVYLITTNRVVVNPEDPQDIAEKLHLEDQEGGPILIGGISSAGEDVIQLELGGASPPPPLPSPSGQPPPPAQEVYPAAADASPDISSPWTQPSGSESGTPAPQGPARVSTFSHLSREHSRKIVMGNDRASRIQKVTSRTSQASERPSEAQPPTMRGSQRLSFAQPFVDELPKINPGISGFDARNPTDRASRASNVLNLMSALSGGHQVAFMYDPDARAKEDTIRRASKAAQSMKASRSSSTVMRAPQAPAAASFTPTARSRSATTNEGAPAPMGNRGRAESSPMSYTAADTAAADGVHLPAIGESMQADSALSAERPLSPPALPEDENSPKLRGRKNSANI